MKIEDEIKSNFRNEYHKLRVNLLLTTTRLGEELQLMVKEFDLSPAQCNTLRILRGQNQQPASIGLIKERMIDKSSDVSRIVDRLLKKKLIARTENKIDRRQKDIVITKLGLELLSQIDKLEKKMDKSLLHLSESDAKQLNKLLDKLRS